MTATDLAADLGLDPEDVTVVVGWLGHHGQQLDPGVCEDVRVLLDDRQARSVPEFYGLAELGWRTDDEEL